MKIQSVIVPLIVLMSAHGALAETAIQAGEWETTEKTSMEGMGAMPETSKKVCLKADEAFLERLLFPPPEERKAHGCLLDEGARKPGIMNATLTCPPSDTMVGVKATAEISYTPSTYKGLGQLEASDKSGKTIKGKSELSGKRLGDCPKE